MKQWRWHYCIIHSLTNYTWMGHGNIIIFHVQNKILIMLFKHQVTWVPKNIMNLTCTIIINWLSNVISIMISNVLSNIICDWKMLSNHVKSMLILFNIVLTIFDQSYVITFACQDHLKSIINSFYLIFTLWHFVLLREYVLSL